MPLCGKCTQSNVDSLSQVISREFPSLKGENARAAALAILASSANGVSAVAYNAIPASLTGSAGLSKVNSFQIETKIQPKSIMQRMDAMQLPNLSSVSPLTFVADADACSKIISIKETTKDADGNVVTKTDGTWTPKADEQCSASDHAVVSISYPIIGFRFEIQRNNLLVGPNTFRIKAKHDGTTIVDNSYTLSNPSGVGQLVALTAVPEKILTISADPDTCTYGVQEDTDSRRWQVFIPGAKDEFYIEMANLQVRAYPIPITIENYTKFMKAVTSGRLSELAMFYLESL